MDRQNTETNRFFQKELEDVCFHSISLIDQNREYLQMHLKETADLPARQALSDIQVETARLERAVQNAATFFHLKEDEPGEPEMFDLRGLVEKTGSLTKDVDTARGIRMEADDGGKECLVMAFPEEAEQLLLQLLSNALCACGNRGRVWVSLKQTRGSAVLCIEDNGCGLPEEAPIENHRRFLGGTGMGLEICRLICRRAGWRLTLTPRPGGGTCAQVVCPLVSGEDIPSVIELHSAGENEIRTARFLRRAEREVLLLRRY